MELYKIPALRKAIIPMLKAFDRDIEVRHPWLDGKRITLSLFKHKGYWYHGKRREKETMLLFSKIIKPNSTIIEVGGHIGFISLWFDNLTRPNGKIFVFEPGSNNLPYIKKNIASHNRIKLIEKAIGNYVGTVDFYQDSLTGQNNSVVKDFEGYKRNTEFSFVSSDIDKVKVPITTIDTEFKDTKIDFIKIDIEGGEFDAICGAREVLLSYQPVIMIEVQADEEKLYHELLSYGYEFWGLSETKITSYIQLKGNVFCLHKEKHKDLINNLFFQ